MRLSAISFLLRWKAKQKKRTQAHNQKNKMKSIQIQQWREKSFRPHIANGHGIAFAIPQTRLVRVEYRKDGSRYTCNIVRPQGQESLRIAMLARHVGMSQVLNVLPVVEYGQRRD